MPKITNAVLAEKIDNLHSEFGQVKEEAKLNTEFRLQLKGFIAGIIALTSIVVTAANWIIIKVFK